MISNKNNYIQDMPIVFSDVLAANTAKTYKKQLTGNGHVKQLNITFVTGENGSLHIRPYLIWNGEIIKDLLNYADGGAHYINGDGVTYKLDCYDPIETDALLCIDAENVGVGNSVVDVVVVVSYEEIPLENTIIGSKGGNL